MTESENSKRVILQATYSPIELRDNKTGQPQVMAKMPFEKHHLVTNVKPTKGEILLVKTNFNSNDYAEKRDFLEAIKAIELTMSEQNNPNSIRNAGRFSDINSELLVSILDQVIKIRKKQTDSTINILNHLYKDYLKSQENDNNRNNPNSNVINQSDKGNSPIPTKYNLKSNEGATNFSKSKDTKGHLGRSLSNTIDKEDQPKSENQDQVSQFQYELSSRDINLKTLLDWSVKNNIDVKLVTPIMELAYSLSIPFNNVTVESIPHIVDASKFHVRGIIDAFREKVKVEPVGYLHLEKLSFTPTGIERGELVYSVPLSPGEEVNITHKEWSNTSEEFQRIVTDYMESYSEEGVSEKNDLAQSSNSQQQHTDGYNLSVTASGGYGPVNITASAGYNASNSSSNSAQMSRTNSMTITRKASSRVTKEHKTSFKVASASGTEDQAVRKIKNVFTDKATRCDYYQLLRKWRVDLSRYGVRLTYDLTIPEPGIDLISKIEDINSIREKLNEAFSFSLKLSEISVDKVKDLVDEYHVAIDPPPKMEDVVSGYVTKSYGSFEESNSNTFYQALDLTVDDNYEVSSGSYLAMFRAWDDLPFGVRFKFQGEPNPTKWTVSYGDDDFEFRGMEFNTFNGRSGRIQIIVMAYAFEVFSFNIELKTKIKQNIYEKWQMDVWKLLYDAKRTEYELEHQMLERRLSEMTQSLGVNDPLSLRKIEREEIMKGVMRWMFGPTFEFSPTFLPDDLYTKKSNKVRNKFIWENVTLFGDYIKFLHHAIEWENMVYILYPYFWSHWSRWDLKKDMQHPDIMHRTFLKSGAARVILTIRPGFEKAFTSFMDNATMLPNLSTPYLTISSEMENYAKTNFPGIPTANPDRDGRPVILPKQMKAWKKMEVLMNLLDLYFNDKKHYPSTAQGLKSLEPYVVKLKEEDRRELEFYKDIRLDPWNNEYQYTYPGIHGEYDLVSYGKDGKADDDDEITIDSDGKINENIDITSWAGSSLIGSWYEYTPTSALDITFNEKLPGEI